MADYIRNKKAFFNYEIQEEFESGIELLGLEARSIRAGLGSLDSSYIIVRGGEAFLVGADIPAFQAKNAPGSYERMRNRKLLLTKPEIAKLALASETKGLTLVPISLYNKNQKIKLNLAIARGKKKFDKRESIKKRDTDREMRRTLKTEN
ncbi:MAG: SsrA-binding protein SmpB [Candidatus Paceibacterota bacterium]